VRRQAPEAVNQAPLEETAPCRGPSYLRTIAKPGRKPHRTATRFAKAKRIRRSTEALAPAAQDP
jgi:hypothetical protein